MTAKDFTELIAWQRADALEQFALQMLKHPTLARDSEFCEQTSDSANSASRNLAEGFGRWSHRDFARYLVMARSEVMEVTSDLMALRRRKTIDVTVADDLIALAERTTKTISRPLQPVIVAPERSTRHQAPGTAPSTGHEA